MKKIVIMLFSVLLLVSCDDPNKDNMVPALEEYPISTWLSMNSEDFSEWVALLEYADLYNTMKLDADYTAFVPTNTAMAKYLSDNGYTSVESISKEDARLLIKYHTIEGFVYTQNEFGNGLLPDSTASGDYLSIEFGERIYVNNEAAIELVDINVTNGVMHSLDAVLQPITATVWDVVNTSEYSIMSEALRLTGYDKELTNLWEGTRKLQYTLLAVPNTAYNKFDISSINDLIAELNPDDSEYTDRNNALNKYVAYHIFDQQYDISSLIGMVSQNSSVNISPLSDGELLNLSIQDTYLFLNYDYENESGTSISVSNINAKNGIIHEVNTPLYIETPPLATVIWEFTDYSELSGVVSDYRKSGLKNNTSKTFEVGDVNCYTWETTTLDQMNSAVTYTVFASTDVRYDFRNYDALTLNLKLYGWIQMESPVILKGKYSVRLHHYSQSSSSKNGKMTLIIDGSYLGSELTLNGRSSSTSTLETTIIGTVVFDETTSHTVRILQTDGNSITLDYLEFVPVD